MKQKFRMFTKVEVCKEMPKNMSHFPSNFKAIIGGSYSQLHGGTDIKSYSLYVLNKNEKRIINRIGWYNESQLTEMPDQNREKCEEMIEWYNLRR